MAFAAAVNLRLPAATFAADTNWPAVTATPDNLRLPAAGSVVIFTLASAFAGESDGSVNPKSAAVKA